MQFYFAARKEELGVSHVGAALFTSSAKAGLACRPDLAETSGVKLRLEEIDAWGLPCSFLQSKRGTSIQALEGFATGSFLL